MDVHNSNQKPKSAPVNFLLSQGTILHDKYKIDSVLAAGGMGRIYKALDMRYNRFVAIKQIFRNLDSDNSELVERFRREYFFLNSIDHKNLVKAYDFFAYGEELLLVLEFIEGISLKDLIKDRPHCMNFVEQVAVANQICRAVEVLNTAGILHRDIKPSNILLNQRSGCIKILDLGLGKNMDQEEWALTQKGAVIGTLNYLSPEQANGEISESMDVFSLGITLHQFFLWMPYSPFKGTSSISTMMEIMTKELPPIADQISPENLIPMEKNAYQKVSQMISASLRKNPADRPSAGEMADCFEQICSSFRAQPQEVTQVDGGGENNWDVTVRSDPKQMEYLRQLGLKYGRDKEREKFQKTRERKPPKKKSGRRPATRVSQRIQVKTNKFPWLLAGMIFLCFLTSTFFWWNSTQKLDLQRTKLHKSLKAQESLKDKIYKLEAVSSKLIDTQMERDKIKWQFEQFRSKLEFIVQSYHFDITKKLDLPEKSKKGLSYLREFLDQIRIANKNLKTDIKKLRYKCEKLFPFQLAKWQMSLEKEEVPPLLSSPVALDSEFSSLLRYFPKNALIYYLWGKTYLIFAQKRAKTFQDRYSYLQEAIKKFHQSLMFNPINDKISFLGYQSSFLFVQANLKDREESLRIFVKYCFSSNKKISNLFLRAYTARKNRKYSEALKYLKNISKKYPNLVCIHLEKTLNYLFLQDYKNAEKAIVKYLKCKPMHSYGFFLMGKIYRKYAEDQKNSRKKILYFAKAAEYYDLTLKKDPYFLDAYVGTALLYYKWSKLVKEKSYYYLNFAERSIEKALKYGYPSKKRCYKIQAKIYVQQKLYKKALGIYNKLLGSDPNDRKLLREKAKIVRKLQR